MPRKIQLGLDKYKFDSSPDVPTIEIFQTTIRMKSGMRQGIRAGSAMPRLPEGFIILYAWHTIADQESDIEIQRCYTGQLPHGKFMYMYTDLTDDIKYGLGNLINCVIKYDKKKSVEYKNAVTRIKRQNVGKANCKMTHTKECDVGEDLFRLHPAYVKTSQIIPKGNELLMPRGYGDRKYKFPT